MQGVDLTDASVAEFFSQYSTGALKPFFKSEAVPADNSGPVKVVVRNNFDEIVMNANKDVLVEFYAPVCFSCIFLVILVVRSLQRIEAQVREIRTTI